MIVDPNILEIDIDPVPLQTFNRCMGLFAQESSLFMISLYQIWRFENALEHRQLHQGYDCLYIPRVDYVTGDLDIHDIVVDRDAILFG